MTGNPAVTIRRARKQRFGAMVKQALRSLPEEVQEMLDNVAIVIEEEPEPDPDSSSTDEEVFGLYQGIPRSERDSGYSMVLPDRITIFSGPLERAFTSRSDLIEQVRITVLHELGHHLGLDEDRLESLGLA